MASPILAMIGAVTLGILAVVAIFSLLVIGAQIGLALGRTLTGFFTKPNKT